MDTPWCLELLGRLRATQGDRVVTRFRARKTGALLAYLAYYPDRPHPREVLIELLWPEVEPHSGRNNLRRELTSLRRQLEPPGVPAGAVIVADRDSVQLNPAACATDVKAFETALQIAARARSGTERAARLTEAAELYQGELLPGYFEEWILPERQRLAELFLHTLAQLMASLEQAGDSHGAIQWARRAVAADPLREETHHELIRLLVAAGQLDAAHRQYQELERLLAQELGVSPGAETRKLVREVEGRQDKARWRSTEAGSSFPCPATAPQTRPVESLTSSPHHLITPTPPPVGTVTFLLAEIDEQTAPAALHDRLRSSMHTHGGCELQAAGEVLRFAFARASDALAAAVAAEKAESGSPFIPHPSFLPRIALHTGEVAQEKQAQQSPALQHATRLLLTASPGQILVSEKSAILLRDDLEPGVQLLDLGLYRLRDAAPPERLYQLCFPNMPAREFPPPNALPAHDGNLPLQFTRFFGRDREIARLCEMLLKNRLLTLTGPGGSGKTRLALEAAGQLRTAFHGAVWFVPLQDLTDARLIADKLLDALRLPRSPQLPPLEQAVTFLSRQPSLLLLDNFEHLVTDGAPLVQTLLERVPTLTCLVTSRQRLNLAGEREFPVPLLPVPVDGPWSMVDGPTTSDPSDPSTANYQRSTLLACASVRLFVDRAQAARPDFQVTPGNAAAVAGVCARLEGLPLALELAAARAGALAPAQMLERLSQRFELLASTQRGTVPRHRSLWAALDWSYQLLSPELQRFFARLSVFQGGWTLDAAEAVCAEGSVGCSAFGVQTEAASPIPNTQHPTPTLHYLEQLRQSSLVQAVEAGAEIRFRLLETLREYGAEQLSAREREELRRRHARYYLAMAEEADSRLRGPELESWMARLKAEHDNMRAVLAWAVAHQDAETALRLGGAFCNLWYMESFLAEGRHWLEVSLQLSGASARTAPRALALRGLAVMAWLQGDYEAARATVGECLSICRELGDKVGIATALGILGWLEHQSGGDLAAMRAAREESLALFREAGDLWGTASATHDLGRSACEEGDYETAWRLHEEAAALFRVQGDPFRLSYPLLGLGHIAQRRGDYAAARRYFAESLAIRARFPGESVSKANALANLATADWCLGNWRAAIAGFERCVELRRLGSFPQAMAWDLLRLGRVAQCAGKPERAAEPLRESLCQFRKYGIRNGEAQALIALGRLAREQQRPAEAPPLLCDGLALAQADTDRAAVATALVETAALLGDQHAPVAWGRAARLLGAAEALRQTAASPVPPYERARRDQQQATVRSALGDAASQAAWAAGRALTLEQAAAEAMQALGKEADLPAQNEE